MTTTTKLHTTCSEKKLSFKWSMIKLSHSKIHVIFALCLIIYNFILNDKETCDIIAGDVCVVMSMIKKPK